MATKRKFQIRISQVHCKACYLCIDACPKKVLEVSTKAFNKEGVALAEAARPGDCIGCLGCATICPDAAIEVLESE